MSSLRILGIITARGGSKGVPRKNIRDLAGKPLIAWSIEAAKGSRLTDCIVSTDDEEIAEVSRQFGGRVPFIRPAEYATDTATSISVVQHALAWLKENEGKEFDAVMILQPTSPMRLSTDIDACIDLLETSGADSVMSMVKLSDFAPKKLKKLDGDRILPYFEDEGQMSSSRQALPDVYRRNCAVYLTKTPFLLANDLFGKDSRAYVMPEERSIDINTPQDLQFADFVLRRQQEALSHA
ncbi:MAG: acylneuraminate cytidylyltransferase family protein [Patescibacteria group bacterium]